MKPSLNEQIAEVAREVALRRGVYGKWVKAGKMTADAAAEHLARMRAALETLEWLRENRDVIIQSCPGNPFETDGQAPAPE